MIWSLCPHLLLFDWQFYSDLDRTYNSRSWMVLVRASYVVGISENKFTKALAYIRPVPGVQMNFDSFTLSGMDS